jgi:serine/threonine-protein kinase
MLYRAVDLRQARTVAVKLASRQYGGRDDSVARLVREGDVIRQLRSPYVIRVLDTGWEAGVAYLVLEYHPAGSLAHWLERRFIIDLATAVGVTCELLRALAYLHEGVDPSVIHRDVTPRNVLIRTERPALRLLLTDFGSARRVDAHGPTADAGITIGSIFSPYYAPPELVGGDRYGWWGPETDIYGACAILYELLTGLPLYQREARRQHVEFHRLVLDPRAAPMRIGAITRGLPPVLDDILTVGLARDPSARFSRARDLLSLLEEVGQRHGRLRIPYADLRRK